MTDISGNSRRPSGTWTTPWVTMFSGGSVWMARPSKVIRPALGFISPEMTRNSDDLPAPLPPMMLTTSFFSTFSDSSKMTWTSP